MGCLQYDHPHNKLISIVQNCSFVSFIFIYFSTSLWFFLFQAQTFIDYVDSFVPTICALLAFLTLCCFFCQRNELLELMLEFEIMTKNRKYIHLFHSLFLLYLNHSHNERIHFSIQYLTAILLVGNQLPLYQTVHLKIVKWTKIKSIVEKMILISFALSSLSFLIYGYCCTDSSDEYYRLSVPAT